MRSPRCSPPFSACSGSVLIEQLADPGPHVSGFWAARIAASLAAWPLNTHQYRPRKCEAVWRRACLAYHEWRQAGADAHEAHEAAVAAVQTVLPLPCQEASIGCPSGSSGG